jgi:hypothetical protein
VLPWYKETNRGLAAAAHHPELDTLTADLLQWSIRPCRRPMCLYGSHRRLGDSRHGFNPVGATKIIRVVGRGGHDTVDRSLLKRHAPGIPANDPPAHTALPESMPSCKPDELGPRSGRGTLKTSPNDGR